MFVNREGELMRLEKRYQSKKAELIIVYGRRRVGKTRLLREFSRNKASIFFLADLNPDNFQTDRFTEVLYKHTGDSFLKTQKLGSWDAIFEYISKLTVKRKLLVVIDEFPYLISANPAVPSILQRYWDERLSTTKICLVLCGSYISVMEQKVLGYRSPLYGRRTAQLMLTPFDFFEFAKFFRKMKIRELMEYYAVCGGIPAYIMQFRGSNIWQEIRQEILQVDSYLYDEIPFLLNEELREPSNYFAILQAIAFGKTKLNEISQMAKIESSKTIRYLDILRDLRIVQRIVPSTEKMPHKSRRGLYKISDYFARFWFRFVYPNRVFIESGEQNYVIKHKIKPFFSMHVSSVFENICIEFLKKERAFNYIGRWWHREVEIDIVGTSENSRFIFGECKWSTRPVGMNIVDRLFEKIDYFKMNYKGKVKKYEVVLFSKSGYTRKCMQEARRLNLRLVMINEMAKPVR